METVYIKTFGCQMNEYDSCRIIKILESKGYSVASSYQEASIILFNTCIVRQKAEHKVYSTLGRLKKLKETKPDLIIGVGGCLAQQQGKILLKKFSCLDLVFGTFTLAQLPNLLAKTRETGERIVCVEMGKPELYPKENYLPDNAQISAFVTIMQGCNNYCAYCIVPYVRGPEVSREPAEIIREAAHLAEHGVKEVTLLGQNVNSYGKTLVPQKTFPELLAAIQAITGIERIRFTTSHPKDLSPELIASFKKLTKLCEHIHLPLQSGANRILKKMSRGYSREEYLAKIRNLRRVAPQISITSDIIVGFPGETEGDFQETMEMVEQVRFDDLFSFRYSDRPGTAASGAAEKVPYDIMKRRLISLQERQKEISLTKNKELIGKTLPVLFDGLSKKSPEKIAGRTRTNKVVNCRGSSDLIGKTMQVKIDNANIHSLKGTVL